MDSMNEIINEQSDFDCDDMSTAMDQILQHMGFLGYEIEIEADGTVMASHKIYENFLIDEYSGGILFATCIKLNSKGESNKSNVLKRINIFNSAALACRCHLDEQLYLAINAYFPDTYTRSAFGVFMAALNRDLTLPYMEHVKLNEYFE